MENIKKIYQKIDPKKLKKIKKRDSSIFFVHIKYPNTEIVFGKINFFPHKFFNIKKA